MSLTSFPESPAPFLALGTFRGARYPIRAILFTLCHPNPKVLEILAATSEYSLNQSRANVVHMRYIVAARQY